MDLDACYRGLDALRHRGPDGCGALVARSTDGWCKPIYNPTIDRLQSIADQHADVFFGHTRLSIIDLDESASQPLGNEDGTVWVAFNGEIYNHRELRQELCAHGHVFKTHHSDTEVLVHGYEEWGERLVERLRGMFAFAILSLPTRKLFLARDRFGEKPLYVSSNEKGICFASELKALLASSAVERDLSQPGLATFLALGFIPAPTTILSDVKKLAAAECVTIDLERPGLLRPSTYWRLGPDRVQGVLPEQARERFYEELSQSIRLRMQSDVPLGAFLSGGMDSSIVVREMSKAASAPIDTFTIGFFERANDESRYASRVAAHYRTNHHTETLDANEMLRVIPLLEKHYDEPFADSSAIPTYLVARMARNYVTVALSGDGGDELLLGYSYYRLLHNIGGVLNRLPDRLVNLATAPLRRLWPEWLRGKGIVKYLEAGDFARYQRYWIDNYLVESALGDPCIASSLLSRQWKETSTSGVVAMAEIDSRLYVPEDLMVKVDRATMAVSLESRAPLLDHKLFEAAAALAVSERFDGRRGKLPFRALITPDLGPDLVDRRKQGFSIPLGNWFRGPLRDILHECLLDSDGLLLSIFPRAQIQKLIRMHMRGSRDQSTRLWRLFVLQRWYNRYGRQHSPPTDSAPVGTQVFAK